VVNSSIAERTRVRRSVSSALSILYQSDDLVERDRCFRRVNDGFDFGFETHVCLFLSSLRTWYFLHATQR